MGYILTVTILLSFLLFLTKRNCLRTLQFHSKLNMKHIIMSVSEQMTWKKVRRVIHSEAQLAFVAG